MRAADGDAPGAPKQRNFGDAPGARAGVGEGDAVEAVAPRRGELDGGANFARQARLAFAVAELAPGGAIVGTGDSASPNFEIVGGRFDGTVDLDAVDLERGIAAGQLELHPGIGACQIDTGHPIAVADEFAFVFPE